jgi:hypothetical protein
LDDERSICRAIRGSAIPTAESAGLERLFAVIEQQDQSTGAAGVRRTLSSRPAARAALAAAACLGIVAVFVWLELPPDRSAEPAEFTTLSTPDTATGPRIDVIFASGTAPADVAAFVGRLGAAVSAGPSEIGRYTLALPADADVEALLERLHDDPLVRFAGRSFIGEDSR